MVVTIEDIPRLSLNVYLRQHWAKQKKFKDTMKILTRRATRARLTGGYTIKFNFYFVGKRLDTINVVHYCKVIEDTLFKQDNQNREICINVDKGRENKVIVELNKIS